MWKRVAILVLAVWVLFSGNAWHHSRANQLNSAIVATGLLFFGALSFSQDWARFVTLALGIWLFAFAAVVSRPNPVTFWNDAMVAVTVFVLSLVGGEGRRPLKPPA
jgi:uncharacterized membrane protein YccC